MKHLCVIGDIVDSRHAPSRADLQQGFKEVLSTINQRSAEHLATAATITLGDEFQAVYRGTGTLFRDCAEVLLRLHPVRVRFSLGVGAIDTPISAATTLDMDGPAFHVARQGMDGAFKRSGRLFTLGVADREVPPPIRLGLDLASHLVGAWNANRLRILCSLFEGMPVKQVAWDLGLSASAIYKSIQGEAMKPLVGFFREVEAYLATEMGL